MTDDNSAGSDLGAARPLASSGRLTRDALTGGTHIACRNSDLVFSIRWSEGHRRALLVVPDEPGGNQRTRV